MTSSICRVPECGLLTTIGGPFCDEHAESFWGLQVQAAEERAEKAEELADAMRAALEVYATPALGCHHWSGSSARDAIAAADAAKG